MHVDRRWFEWLVIAVPMVLPLLVGPAVVHAEGTGELNQFQALESQTELFVDIVNPADEVIVWTGRGDVTVTAPNSQVVGTFSSGQTISPLAGVSGAYEITLLEDQFDMAGMSVSATYEWDVSVSELGAARPGRLWSYNWRIRTMGFDEEYSVQGSFYGLVTTGQQTDTAIMEIRFEGLAGYFYYVYGSSAGAERNGKHLAHSVPFGSGASSIGEIPLYLNPPQKATFTALIPNVTSGGFSGGPAGCDMIVPGTSVGTFTFDTNVEGTYHIVCDLDGDATYNLADFGDLHLIGKTVSGLNTVSWDGTDNIGNPVQTGAYSCQVMVTVGELHYVALDVETSYPGMRIFEVTQFGARNPLAMYWNDSLVQASANQMPNGDTGAETSGPSGLSSGSTVIVTSPHGETIPGNARAWGDFASGGDALANKGNDNLLDTYAWLDSATSVQIVVQVETTSADADGDTVPDYLESCVFGTNPSHPDSDGDGVGDAVETAGGTAMDTDSDGIIDALDDDDDGDGILTENEDIDGDGDPTNDDSDGDAVPNYLDADDEDGPLGDLDGDQEANADDNCPTVANAGQEDLDGDGAGDACDSDADGDGVDAGDDCDDLDPTASAQLTYFADPDGDGYGDPGDSQSVCSDSPPAGYVADDTDNCPDVANTDQADSDSDGLGDACDTDDPPTDDSPDSGCGCTTGRPSGSPLPLYGFLLLCWLWRRRARGVRR